MSDYLNTLSIALIKKKKASNILKTSFAIFLKKINRIDDFSALCPSCDVFNEQDDVIEKKNLEASNQEFQ